MSQFLNLKITSPSSTLHIPVSLFIIAKTTLTLAISKLLNLPSWLFC